MSQSSMDWWALSVNFMRINVEGVDMTESVMFMYGSVDFSAKVF